MDLLAALKGKIIIMAAFGVGLVEHHTLFIGTVTVADLNEQAQQRKEALIAQLKSAECITEALKAADPISWTQRMNNITASAEEIIREEMIYNG